MFMCMCTFMWSMKVERGYEREVGGGQQREMEYIITWQEGRGWTIWGRKQTTKKGKVCKGGTWPNKEKNKKERELQTLDFWWHESREGSSMLSGPPDYNSAHRMLLWGWDVHHLSVVADKSQSGRNEYQDDPSHHTQPPAKDLRMLGWGKTCLSPSHPLWRWRQHILTISSGQVPVW